MPNKLLFFKHTVRKFVNGFDHGKDIPEFKNYS